MEGKTYNIDEKVVRRKFGKNYLEQIVLENQTLKLLTENPLVFEGQEDCKILFTKHPEKASKKYKYIIKSDKIPNFELLLNGELKNTLVKYPYSSSELSEMPKMVVKSWDNGFEMIEENYTNKVYGLRSPQIGAIHAVLAHWRIADEIGTIVMPTGTGKTETMMALMVINKCQRLLVTVPTEALRQQLSEKFMSYGILKKFGIVSEKCLFPVVGIMYSKPKTIQELDLFISRCNVIITTMSIASGLSNEMQKYLSDNISHYFVDEAHHARSKTWETFVHCFEPYKIIQFTATPFRNDGKRLDGRIIFNYPMRKAQEEGYFKKINFCPVYDYNYETSDQTIADEAVKALERDLKDKKNHIIMARCKDIKRSEEVFICYEKFKEFCPTQINSKMSILGKMDVKEKLKTGEIRIVICVDMLGEGFDLPNLKIAAFHDVKQSLPVTLQLAGRFTRTRYDEVLGEATFIANLADTNVKEEVDALFSYDSDWNQILPLLSKSKIESELKFNEFINGFKMITKLPVQNLRPSLSTVVYKNPHNKWYPEKFREAIDISDESNIVYDINNNEKVICAIRGKKQEVKWGDLKEIYNIEWDIFVVYWNERQKLLFIHGSDKNTLYQELANAIISEKAEIINKVDIFKAFFNIKRIRLQNVGLKEFLGKNIKFRMSFGTDVEEALSIQEKNRGQKAFVYGNGYEDGEKISLGCSYKGRIWSRLNGDIQEFTFWCNKIGQKLINNDIDGNQVLKETLIPNYISSLPNKTPFTIDWDEQIYIFGERRIQFTAGTDQKSIEEVQINVSAIEGKIEIHIDLSPRKILTFELEIFKEEEEKYNYRFNLLSKEYAGATVDVGDKKMRIEEFLDYYTPTVWYTDGSSLTGNEYIELKQLITPYDRKRICVWDWEGVDLAKEAQGVNPIITDSIQYHVIKQLLLKKYEIIYDDDGRGEAADIITIVEEDSWIIIELYHLKYSKDGVVNKRIDNLYEVCGQAQKSILWKHWESKKFFDHLLRRMVKRRKDETCSRFIKGDEAMLKYFSNITKRKYPVEFRIFIVQPGLSKEVATAEQLMLLSVTENYIKEVAGIDLVIIGNN